MSTIIVGQTDTWVLKPASDALGDPGAIQAGSVQWTADATGIISSAPSADGLTNVFTGIAPGVVNITPSAVNSAGATITGNVITITVNPAPVPPATTLLETETVGPVP